MVRKEMKYVSWNVTWLSPKCQRTIVKDLAEFIKNHQASYVEISKAVAQKQVIAPPEAIARLFEEHDLKKTPR